MSCVSHTLFTSHPFCISSPPPPADFGNVKNKTRVAVHSHSKNLRAHRAREARAWHHHAVLDPRAGRRCLGARATQVGAGVHALAAEGDQEACPSKTGEARKARVEMPEKYAYVSVRSACTERNVL